MDLEQTNHRACHEMNTFEHFVLCYAALFSLDGSLIIVGLKMVHNLQMSVKADSLSHALATSGRRHLNLPSLVTAHLWTKLGSAPGTLQITELTPTVAQQHVIRISATRHTCLC